MRLRWRLEVLRDQKGQCRVVVRLSDNCRVIECRDDIQWIIQVRYGNRWMPPCAGMTAEIVDARHKAGHDEGLGVE